MPDRLLSPAEAGARIGRSAKTIRRLVYARKLPARPRGIGKQRPGIGIPESALDAYIRGGAR